VSVVATTGGKGPDPDPDRHPPIPVRDKEHEYPLADLIVVQAVAPGPQAVDFAAGAPKANGAFVQALETREGIEGYLGNNPGRIAFEVGLDGLDLGEDDELAQLVPLGQAQGTDGGRHGGAGEDHRQD